MARILALSAYLSVGGPLSLSVPPPPPPPLSLPLSPAISPLCRVFLRVCLPVFVCVCVCVCVCARVRRFLPASEFPAFAAYLQSFLLRPGAAVPEEDSYLVH